jgi:mono/diheme cytochrome c family protein
MMVGLVQTLRRWSLTFLAAGSLAVVANGAGLEWDALEKRYEAKVDEEEAALAFSVTNRTDHDVVINSTSTSCHCTVATPPRTPWIIDQGATEVLNVTVDLRGRSGGLTKTIYVDTSEGEQLLLVHVIIPPPTSVRRQMNLIAAQADRQAVFKADCASCHVAPTVGKKAGELFQTACVICHAAEHRATMVPDLMVAKGIRDEAYWKKWIREGAEGTLMPAFAKEHGGPLEEGQITSLIAYLVDNLPGAPASK